jgi:hypothetical protein
VNVQISCHESVSVTIYVLMQTSLLAEWQYRFRIEIANIPCRVPCVNIRHQNLGHKSRAASYSRSWPCFWAHPVRLSSTLMHSL